MQSARSPQNPLASHWNAGGWFGSQLGSTAWLFVSAFVIGTESPKSAAVLFGCGLASNLIGCVLWSQRARLNPYRAFQLLAFVVALSGFAATRWLEVRGEFGLLDPRVSPRTMYSVLFTVLLVLVPLFELQLRAAKKAAA